MLLILIYYNDMYLIMHELFIVYVHDTDIESTEHI